MNNLDKLNRILNEQEDDGEFLSSSEIEVDNEMTSDQGIFTFDVKSKNPKKHLKFFVRVGGGFQGFKKKVNAKRFLKED